MNCGVISKHYICFTVNDPEEGHKAVRNMSVITI